MSDLYKEALADIKKLKEVAEANAKDIVLESITPKIKQYIEDQLLKQKKSENTTLSENSILTLANISNSSAANYNDVQTLINEAFSNLNKKERNNLTSALSKISKNNKKKKITHINNNDIIQENFNMRNQEKFYEVDLRLLKEQVDDAKFELAEKEQDKDLEEIEEMYDEGADYGDHSPMEEMEEMDYDLDELDEEEYDEDSEVDEDMLNEIKLALDLGEDIEEDMIPEELRGMIIPEEDEDEESEEGDEDFEDMEDEESEEEGDDNIPNFDDLEQADEDPQEKLDEVFDVDPNMLRQEIANIKSMLSEGKMDHHFGGKGGGNAGHKNAFGGSGPKKAGYQKSFGGGSYGKDVFQSPPGSLKKLNEAKKMLRKLSRANRAQAEKLKKYRSAVHTLREQLEDLNLFNAKLLYVNKLLQNKSLSESHKKSVIKALDEAKTLSETKSLFTSLTQSLAGSQKSKTLNESKLFGSSSRTTSGSSIKSVVGEVDRWQKLAGLK